MRVMATGRSDYPNQINNVLAFPGIFRGALDVRAPAITEEMKLAAARGIAATVADDELAEDYIIPSVFNRDVSREVARAVAEEAERAGAVQGAGRDRRVLDPDAEEQPVKVTVTGATGTLGRELVRSCSGPRRRGDRALARRRPRAARRSATRSGAVEWTEPEGRRRRPPRRWRARTAWSTCSASPSPSAGATTAKREIRDSRVLATRNLVAGTARPGRPRPRCWCPSRPAAGTAPAATSAWTSPSRPPTTSSRRSAWSGRPRRARPRSSGMRVALTRTGVVLSESGGALEKMLPPFKLGVGGPVAGGDQYVPWIHTDDVVGALLFCARHRDGERAAQPQRPGAGDQQGAVEGAGQRAQAPGVRAGAGVRGQGRSTARWPRS